MKDSIKELFSQSLSNQELPVREGLFEAIQAKVALQSGASAGVVSGASKSVGLFGKFIGGAAVLVGAVGTVVYFNQNEQAKKLNEKVVVKKTDDNQESKTDVIQGEEMSVEVKEPISTISGPSTVIFNAELLKSSDRDVDISTPNSDKLLNTVLTKESITEADETVTNSSILKQTELKKKEEVSVKKSEVVVDNMSDINNTELGKIQVPIILNQDVNFFSPNGDGKNDTYFLETENVKKLTFTVFDKDFKPVYTTDDVNFQWDGNDKAGNALPQGTYVSIVILTGKDGKEVPFRKIIDLRR